MRRNNEDSDDGYMREKQKVGRLRYVINRNGKRYDSIVSAINPDKIISIVGAGGKSSIMFTLGEELAKADKVVTLTTTTRVLPYDLEIHKNMHLAFQKTDSHKLAGVDNPIELAADCDFLLIEADGSRGYPLKMPAAHEPVIIDSTNQVIAVVGLSCIGRPIMQVCHRSELVCDFLNKKENDPVTVEDVRRIILSERGLSKGTAGRDMIVVLNQADTEREIALGLEIARELPDSVQCIITAYEDIN